MLTRTRARLAWGGGLVLVVLHLHLWDVLDLAGIPDSSLAWGWAPVELLARLGWMALAFVYLWWFCARVWRER